MNNDRSVIRVCHCLATSAGLVMLLLAFMAVRSQASSPKNVGYLQQGTSKSAKLALPKMPKRPGIAVSNKSA